MNHIDLLLTLESDVSVPASAATLSGRSSLHYLPGASIRGAVAAQLYERDEDAAFTLFHTHGVQFGNAYPAWFDGVSYHSSLPWPLSFKKPKGGRSDGPTYRNCAAAPLEGQHSVVREPVWMIASGSAGVQTIGVRSSGGLRTTIATDGKASDGLLFQMDAITSGQEFVARIHVANAEMTVALVQELDGALLSIGRSRNAEYGRVRCKVLSEPLSGLGDRGIAASPAVPDRLRLYLLSDVALVDALGSPQLVPTPQAFGLDSDAWRWDPVRSEIDTRSYSPWVGAWCRPDMERYVIIAGSVVTFTRSSGTGPSVDVLSAQCATMSTEGVGRYRYDGLGRVLVEPEWLDGVEIDATPLLSAGDAVARLPGSVENEPFIQWVRQEHHASDTFGEVMREVVEFARSTAGKAIIKGRMIPNSQWGQLQYAAQRALRQDPETLIPAFKKVAEKGVSGLKWKQRFAGESVLDRVTNLLNGVQDPEQRCRVAVELATEMRLRNDAHRNQQNQSSDEQQGVDA